MKTNPFSFLLLSLAASVAFAVPAFAAPTPAVEKEATAESGFAPKEYPLSRYAPLDKKSPFEFDPPPVKTEETANPFENVSLAGYAGSGKTLTVYIIVGGKEKQRMTVYGDGSPFKKRDKSGYRIVELHPGKTLKKTSVTLEKDGVQGKVEFDADTLKPKATGPAGQGVQMVPGPNGQMIPRQMVPRPTGAGAPQTTYQAPAPFIPGQSGNQQNPQQQQQQQQQQQINGQIMNNGQPQAVGSMSNQQLVNHLTGPNGQPIGGAPITGQQPQVQGGEPPRVSVPPQRRRVVLPTQQ